MTKTKNTKRFQTIRNLEINWTDVWKSVALVTIVLNFLTFRALITQDSMELLAGAISVAIATIGFTLAVFFKRDNK